MKIQYSSFKTSIKKNINSLPLILLYGANQSEIKTKSKEAITLICGPSGLEEMRISSLTEAELLKDPASFYNQLKTASFFPGKQVLIIESATDKICKILTDALKCWSDNDPTIIITANTLRVTSSLRKIAEEHPEAICLPIYDEQRDTEKFEERINSSTLKITDLSITKFLKNSRNFYSLNSFLFLIEKLEIYKFRDPRPLTFHEIELVMSEFSNPTIYDMINHLANGDIKNTILLLRSLFSNGITTNQIIILTSKHFTLLHKLSLYKSNPDIVFRQNYPPLYGHRKKQIIQHSTIWSTKLIERAIKIIVKVEQQLRTPSKIELTSTLERSFLRISSLVR